MTIELQEQGGELTGVPIAQQLQQQIASLLLFQSVLATDVGEAFLELLECLRQMRSAKDRDLVDRTECLRAYGRWFRTIAHTQQSWQDYLVERILQADNPFTDAAQQGELTQVSPALVAAAQHDLQVLKRLYQCDGQCLSAWVREALALPESPVPWGAPSRGGDDRISLHGWENWANSVADLAAHYRQFGTGLLAQYQALRWQDGALVGIACPDAIEMDDLVGYGWQRDALVQNTEALLEGFAALHVLLYGSRGVGKSSLVKSLLGRYGARGLRLVEVSKAALMDLPAIVDRLRPLPQKFIIFVDDLSFEAEEGSYKALKVVLEGNLTARTQNVVVYATSNRRHLIREFYGDRPSPKDAEEVHAWDTVQEKLSLSDRFGLTLTFEPTNQMTYLQIVRHLADRAKVVMDAETLERQALLWATRHNGRSGRTARQFVDFLVADLAITARRSGLTDEISPDSQS